MENLELYEEHQEENQEENQEYKKQSGFLYYFFGFCVRFSHWFDLVLYFFLCDWLYNSQFKNQSFGIAIYFILFLQIYYCVKYEYQVFKSKVVCKSIIRNGRVMGFGGKQGAGKSSFATYLASFKEFTNVYTNTPCKNLSL